MYTDTCIHRYRYNFYILHYLDHLANMPKILISHLAHHTHIQIHRHMYVYRYRYHFYILHFLAHLAYMPKIFGVPQNCTYTDTHMYRDINTQIQIH